MLIEFHSTINSSFDKKTDYFVTHIMFKIFIRKTIAVKISLNVEK